MPKKSAATIYKKIVAEIEKDNMSLFCELDMKGEITPELKADYLEFCNTLRDVFDKTQGEFKPDKVYERIPRNTWISKFHGYLYSK